MRRDAPRTVRATDRDNGVIVWLRVSAGSCAGCAAGLANNRPPSHAPAMFVVTEEDEAAIRAAFEQRGEFATAVELRRLFPGITDNAQARQCARTIASWKPLPLRPVKRLPRLRRMV